MADKELTQFVKQLMSIIPDIHRELTKAPKDAFTRGIISAPQMTILLYLHKKKICIMSNIAKLLSVSMSAATGLIDRMIKNKLLVRYHGVEDRRIVRVAITKRGRDVAKSIMQQRYKMIKRLFKNIGKADREKYLDIIKKMHRSIVGKRAKR